MSIFKGHDILPVIFIIKRDCSVLVKYEDYIAYKSPKTAIKMQIVE